MKYLVLIFFLFIVQLGFSQKDKPVYFEFTRDRSSTGLESFNESYQFSLTKRKEFGKNTGLMEVRLHNYKVINFSDSTRSFSSDGSIVGKNVLNRLRFIPIGYLLEHPVVLKFQDGVVRTDTLKLNEQLTQQLQQWKIDDDYSPEVLDETYEILKIISSLIYLSDFSGLAAKDLKVENINRNNKTYQIMKRDKGLVTLSYVNVEDPTSQTNVLVKINSRDMSTEELNSLENFEIAEGNRLYQMNYKINLKKVKDIPLDKYRKGLASMLIKSSYWSSYLKKGAKTDSLSVLAFIKDYELNFSNFPIYILNKLSALQGLDSYSVYEKELNQTSNSILKGTYHLINKIRNSDLSIEEFKEIALLMDKEFLYDFIQNDFSQKIASNSANYIQNLMVLAHESTRREKQASLPMLFWIETKEKDDLASLTNALDQLLKLDEDYWIMGNAGRYALLIQKNLFSKGSKDLIYLDQIISKLTHLIAVKDSEFGKIQKAHLAYANFLAYEQVGKTNSDLSLKYLKEAKNHSVLKAGDYALHSFYDEVFLKSKKSYADYFYKHLANLGKIDEALTEFVKDYASNPGANFKKLREYYDEHYAKNTFADFYKSQVIPHLTDAPAFLLTNLEGKSVSKADFAGKWTVVDFWGTWCGPCVQEMPKLNAYYLELQKQESSKIEFTIACKDSENAVKEYLAQNKYSIPVLMSDNQVERQFEVRAFPSKFIITPEGKMLNTEQETWQDQVKELAGLE
ncbi:TlpA family protein disulfide reductase [Sphingobacterium sp. HJSM2_6]|uniref:TlpA family protein disulfide reductase n=1 Tax=Sphingobacterium sp. HJSM2_6 TaxID=3366264 RepID=UPI003BC50CFD